MKLARFCLALLAPLALTGCFLAPGAFTANLDLKRNGDFTFAYKGEIVFQSPDDFGISSPAKTWSDKMAVCPKEGDPRYEEYRDADSVMGDDERPCSAAERARLKGDFEKAQAAKAEKEAKDAAQFAAMFGFNPKDEEANRKLAATMMRYDGWRSVTYQGNGVFAVDYLIEGKAGQGFVFPLLPQGDLLIPFVVIRAQDKGSVRIGAPALIGGGLKGLAAQMKAIGAPADKELDKLQSKRTRGTFTVTTDGEILTNNTEDGPVSAGGAKRLVWTIDPSTEKAPEALIRLR